QPVLFVDVSDQFNDLHDVYPSRSNNVFSPVPFASCFLSFASVLPSTSSQFTSSIGCGTTRTNVARLTASKPLPPRDTTSYFAGPNSIIRPPDVSSTNLSNRPPISAP